MLSINLPTKLEKRLQEVVQDKYHGNFQVAFGMFLKLHEKYAWKEQFREDVESIRAEIRRKGGITSQTIAQTIRTYRQQKGKIHV